ncbi:MNIO family bufferin maturase [Microvirga sp. G4-2]|uniref:MNIO family bufferin maturase n=1 Tax=Microvirga sp. G4-2 TaxID=3434467 RepID=UPI004044B38E
MTTGTRLPTGAGVGLRLPHLAEVVATRPPAAWLETHPENFLANPHATELLTRVAAHYPISVHTVGVSIGSAKGIDCHHLRRVRGLIARVDPVLVSGHLAWSTHEGEYLNDLLPLPYDEETLALLVRHVDEVQEGLGRPYLVENPSSYVGFGTSTMTEVEFLSELVRRTGCRLLCDVSNVYLSAHNMGYDAYAYLDGLPVDAVGELHLGGFTPEEDESDPGSTLLIDTHASPITGPVWDLYAHAVRRFGPVPTMIEWDNDLPPFATLLAEAAKADVVATQARHPENRRAVAC